MRKPMVQTDGMRTKVDVTPIIDVALVLVIILLITAPMLSVADMDLDLPAAHSRDGEEPSHVTITLDRHGAVAVDETVLASLADLPAELHRRLDGEEADERLVVVRADAGLPHTLVREVMDKAREGGAVRLGLATRQGSDS